jgi:hypothetical protein
MRRIDNRLDALAGAEAGPPPGRCGWLRSPRDAFRAMAISALDAIPAGSGKKGLEAAAKTPHVAALIGTSAHLRTRAAGTPVKFGFLAEVLADAGRSLGV